MICCKFIETLFRGYFNFIEEKANNYLLDTKASDNQDGKSLGVYGLVVIRSPSHLVKPLGKNDLFELIKAYNLIK